LFGKTVVQFGQTKESELAAAIALRELIFNDEDITKLNLETVNTIRSDATLSRVYEWLAKVNISETLLEHPSPGM
jgi:hypothetical protein